MALLRIEVQYQRGDIVYLKTDKDQLPRVVNGHAVYDGVMYILRHSSESESYHYDIEITKDKNVVLATTN